MITPSMQETTHKFVYLLHAYPEKTVPQVIGLFQIPPIDINNAIWAAVELGYIETEDSTMTIDDLDKAGQKIGTKEVPTVLAKILKLPEAWEFGEVEQHLEDSIQYAFEKLNADEKDMEENYLGNWTGGYAAQDTLIATKRLLDKKVLHEYEIEDGDSAYIFYTLAANAGKNWGAKQFKTNPLTGEKQSVEDDRPEEDKALEAEQKEV